MSLPLLRPLYLALGLVAMAAGNCLASDEAPSGFPHLTRYLTTSDPDTELFQNVSNVHDAFPDKKLLMTEGCREGGPHLNDWGVGERYGHSMIEDLNHWSVGWVDWNMVLDQTGGPNHVGNLCSAPIIANTDTGEVLKQPSYYYIGQFAKFIRPGAVRVLAATTNENLETTAFVNPDGSTVVVIMNRTELSLRFELKLGAHAVKLDVPEHSIQTVVITN